MALGIIDLVVITLLVIGVYSAMPHIRGMLGQDTKTCPYCAETIRKRAILCRFCGRSLDAYFRD